jgi:mannosyltransferase
MSAPSTPRHGPGPAQPGASAASAPSAPAQASSPAPSAPITGTRGATAIAAWWLPVAFVAAVMTVLGLWDLARHNAMGNDEVASRYAAMLSLGQLFHLLSHVDAVHGFYYLLLHCWIAVGSTPATIRIPSLVFMAAGAGLVVIIGRRLTGSALAGLFAGLIMVLTPIISFYAQTARSYALVFCCVVATTLALLRALEADSVASGGRPPQTPPNAGWTGARLTRRWLLYGALVTVGGYLNELFLLVLAAHAVTVLLTRYGRPTVKRWLVSAVVGAILVLPVIVLSVKERAAVGWIPRPDVHDIGILFHDYFGATNLVSVLMFLLAVLAVLPATRLPAIRVSRPRPGSGPVVGATSAWWNQGGLTLPSVAVPLLVLPGGLLIVESLIGKPLYADRYVLYGEAGAALLAGAGIYRLGQWLGPWLTRHLGGASGRSAVGWRSLVWLPGVILCVLALVLQLGAQQRTRTAQAREFDFGDPAFYIGAHAHQGDGVLFFNTFYRKIRLGYPRDFAKITDFSMAVSPQKSGTYNGINKPFPVVRSLMLTYQRIWVVGRAPSLHVTSSAIRGEGALLMSSYTRIYYHHYKGIVVTLWLRR